MSNSTNSTDYIWGFEYYYDVLDPVPVDASKLKYNRYSIVIILWVTIVSFIGSFFFVLAYMSRFNNLPRSHRQSRKRNSSDCRRSHSSLSSRSFA
ncbi:hypothetical protein ACEWY4_008722 [Coilia grayii]|uniref:Melanocortin-2 receptor accessory protein n=1 Tax=Coilia grayii TaxID=363190 RepID=A0ABD1KBZ7_9TELE